MISHTLTSALIVRTKGDGLYTKLIRSVPLRIEIEVDPDSIKRTAGEIEFAYCMFTGTFSERYWDVRRDGLLYTDSGVQGDINAFLFNNGYPGTVGWSERGRQGNDYIDFDMDYSLIEHVFPQLRAAA